MKVQTSLTYGHLVDSLVEASGKERALIEIEGAAKRGKTNLLNAVITGLVNPSRENASKVVLFAGESEIEAARARWADHPGVVVQGRLPENEAYEEGEYDLRWSDWFADITKERKENPDWSPEPLTVIFDDWFTEADGSLRLYDDEESLMQNRAAYERAEVADVIPFLREARIGIIAAFRPGHTSPLTPEYLGDADGYERLTVQDHFARTLHGDFPADACLIPDPEADSEWRLAPAVSESPWEHNPNILAPDTRGQ